MKTVKSILHGDRIAYEVSGNSMEWWSQRSGMDLLGNIGRFDTYGDGICKHSPTVPAQFNDLPDACLSLAAAMLAEPHEDLWKNLCNNFFFTFNDAQLRFALDVRYKEEGPTQYYSLPELKVTRANKQHDRRYERVEEWAQGNVMSALQILLRSSHDWLVRIWITQRLLDIANERGDGYLGWDRIFPKTTELEDGWYSNFIAFKHAITAIANLESAKSYVDNAITRINDKKKEEVACA